MVKVLRGVQDARIERLQHDRLSVFGIGADLEEGEWRALFRQLIARGLLAVDEGGYGVLRLTEASRPLLRGETRLALRRRQRPARREKRRAAALEELGEADRALFEDLRALRLRLAREQSVPPYVIFSDATLRAMAEQRPRDREALLGINGVGARKLERYGEAFLEVIAGAD